MSSWASLAMLYNNVLSSMKADATGVHDGGSSSEVGRVTGGACDWWCLAVGRWTCSYGAVTRSLNPEL